MRRRMCAEMEIEKKTIIPCKCKATHKGMDCPYGLLCDNTRFNGITCWCGKWRENHSKDGIIYGCDENFEIA